MDVTQDILQRIDHLDVEIAERFDRCRSAQWRGRKEIDRGEHERAKQFISESKRLVHEADSMCKKRSELYELLDTVESTLPGYRVETGA